MQDDTTNGSEIFRPQALSRLASADDLDRYIRVTRPSGWVVLIASLCLLLGIGIWSVAGSIPTTKTFSGILSETDVVCWVDETTYQRMRQGNVQARVADVGSTEVLYDNIPLSSAEILKFLSNEYLAVSGDYLSTVITSYDWNYLVFVTLESEVPQNERIKNDGDDSIDAFYFVPVEITTSETRPIDLLLGKG